MIFVTVGTNKYKFKRLIHLAMMMRDKYSPDETIIIQSGVYNLKSKKRNTIISNYFEFSEMISLIKKSRLVISHCGSGTVLLTNTLGKVPFVLVRNHRNEEHTNNHQEQLFDSFIKDNRVERLGIIGSNFASAISKEYKNIVKGNDLLTYLNNVY